MLSTYALQTMVDTLPVAACVFIGTDHTLSAANRQMLDLWNREHSIIGTDLVYAIPELHQQGFAELLKNVYESGQDYRDPEGRAELFVDGETQILYFDISLKPLRDREGAVYGVVSTAVDTSDRVRTMMQLEQTVEELAATNEELNSLNEEYLTLNEELQSGSEELRATNEELYDTKARLERSMADLADSEERLLLAAEAVNLGMFDIDLLDRKIVTSGKFDRIFGLDAPADLETYQNAIHPDDAEIREKALEKAFLKGRLYYEVRVIRPDDSVIWVRTEGKVIFGETGAPVRILGTLLDFTTERHDKEVQRKLKTLADNSADLMSLLDLDGKNSYINEAGKELLGFSDDLEVMNTPIAELHAPEDFEQVQRDVLPTVMSKGKWVGTMKVRHLKTGEIFPVLNYTVRIDEPGTGNTIGIGAIMRDLRPEIAGKKALADSENLLKNVTSAAPIGLWMADQDGQFTYVNERWADWTGLSQADNLGQGWLNSIAAEDRQRVSSTYAGAFRNQRAFETEYRIAGREEQMRWFSTSGQPQFDSAGHFAGFVGACIDVTGQKELQQHKDDFISIASHELKTPVTSLKAAIQLLNRIRIKSENPMVPKLLLQAGKSVERVGSLIDDLLNVGRLQQQELKLIKTKFIVSEMLNACANPVALAGKQKIRISGDLELEVFADEHRIDQVVTNFLTNAVKYAAETDVIEVTVERMDTGVKVAVKDKGPGISPERLKNLFDRYYRADETARHISGLGLGLYICAEIIRRHKGRIGAESEPGKGSTFWFTLPLDDHSGSTHNDIQN